MLFVSSCLQKSVFCSGVAWGFNSENDLVTVGMCANASASWYVLLPIILVLSLILFRMDCILYGSIIIRPCKSALLTPHVTAWLAITLPSFIMVLARLSVVIFESPACSSACATLSA